MLQTQTIDFGEWLPDMPAHNNPGALEIRNAVPRVGGYLQLNDLSAFSNALASVCLGAFWAQDENNVVFNFAGDANNLYQLQNSITWTNVNGLSAPYTVDNWEFTKFGNRVIAVGKAAPPQYWDLGVSAAFADLPNAPNAARIATVRDFVMLGDVDGLGPNFVRWSGYNDTEAWTPSLATQSDFQELFGRAGRVQRIVPGEIGMIFCEQSLFRAEYVGPPLVFQFDEVESQRGTPAPNSVVWTGDMVFYYGWDGFYQIDVAGNQRKISAGKVTRWFASEADNTAYDTMRAAVCRVNSCVIWAFKTSASLAQNNRLLFYSWIADRWAYAEVDTQIIESFVSAGLSLDQLDTPLPGGIDTDSIPVDSPQFAGGVVSIYAFDASNQAATFSGTPLTATLDTKEISGPDHSRMMVSAIRPLVEGSPTTSITVQVGQRNRLTENVNFSAVRNLNGLNGEANVRLNSRYQRYRVNVANGFEHGNGVKISGRLKGRR